MAEEEGVVVKSDVAMSTSDHAAADSEEGALSDVMSQHTENKGGDTDIIESVNATADAAVVEEEEDNAEEENFEIEPELEPTENPIETKIEDDNASKHSDGQLTTDNEDDEMENYTQNQNTNGENYDEDNGLNFRPPLNAFNGDLEYTVPQNFLIDGEGLENRLHNIRHNIEHLFNQMNIFKEGLTDTENFDIDEFTATFLEMSTVISELSVISGEFDELHEKVSSEYFKCLDKYEENANICGGHLLNAKLNKARQIRDLINSWHQSTEVYKSQITDDVNLDEENEPNSYYDNSHSYQILSRNIPSTTTGYTYVADIPPPALPSTFFVPPTALPSFSAENVNMNAFNDDSDNEKTTDLPTDLISTHTAPPPKINAPEHPESHNSPSIYNIPPMISLATSLSFNTPPTMIASNILPPMNIPPPAMNLPPQNIPSQSNVLSQSNISTSDPKIILPPFQSTKPMPPKAAPVLIPGLNIANTAPLFAQTPSSLLSDTSLIPTQLPTVPLAGANYGVVRKQNPQIAPLINLNLSTMGSKSPAQNQISQSTSSSHIPSLLSIEVPFPIEILKRNQSQAQQQRFNNRSRRSPVVNTEPKESTTTKEKESQSVKSDEPMDSTEQQSLTEEPPVDPIIDNPGS